MGKERRAVCSDGLVVEVRAAVLLKLGLRSKKHMLGELRDDRRVDLSTAGVPGSGPRRPQCSSTRLGALGALALLG